MLCLKVVTSISGSTEMRKKKITTIITETDNCVWVSAGKPETHSPGFVLTQEQKYSTVHIMKVITHPYSTYF